MTARRITLAAAAIATAAMAGCSQEKYEWVKPGASNEEFSQGISICTEEAKVVTGRGQVTHTDEDEYGRCLTEFGFSRQRRGN